MTQTPKTLTADLLAKLLATDSPSELVSILGLAPADFVNLDTSEWSVEDRDAFGQLRAAVEATARLPIREIMELRRPETSVGSSSGKRPPVPYTEHATLTNRFARIYYEPLRVGAAATIGSALRRVLLSFEGAAITAVKIDGILHESSSIPRIVEDVADIIFNLQQIPLTLHGAGPKLIHLSASRPGRCTSGDIEPAKDVDILDREIYIGTLSDGGSLDIEMRVENGHGYVSAGHNSDENLGIGYIPVDSMYSPVTKVNYLGEKGSDGAATYERLILEVWTNGAVTARDAVSRAAKIIRADLYPLVALDELEISETRVTTSNELLGTSVETLELSVRSYNCLKNANIKTIGELVRMSEAELQKTQAFGRKSLNEIKEILSSMDLSLGMEIEDLESSAGESHEESEL